MDNPTRRLHSDLRAYPQASTLVADDPCRTFVIIVQKVAVCIMYVREWHRVPMGQVRSAQ
jgi:hypothetical protein